MVKKIEDTAVESAPRGRTARKKVYVRERESAIPKELQDLFKKDNYDLKLVRWAIQGEEDYRYLHRREREGYEFVTLDEIPQEYRAGMHQLDSKTRQGLVTLGDLVLMKVDTDLRNSRRKVYQQITDQEVASVDVNVLEKKGFKNLGSKSRVMMREPTFGE